MRFGGPHPQDRYHKKMSFDVREFRNAMGCFATIALGIVGSFLGGLLMHVLLARTNVGFQPAGFLGAIVGGVLVLLILRRRQPRTPLV